MRKLFFLGLVIVLLSSASRFALASCTVEIVKTDVWWESVENYGAYLRADIYQNGNLIPPGNQFYYKWYGFCGNNGFWKVIKEGYGENEAHMETLPGDYMKFYVVVTDTSGTYFTTITSDTTEPVSMPSNGAKPVPFKPVDENGNSLYNYVQARHWRYTIDEWRIGYRSLLTKDWDEIITAIPDVLPSICKKFKCWNNNTENYLNYNTINVNENLTHISPVFFNYDTTAIIKNQFVEGVDVSGDSIEFKDPWVVDSTNSAFYNPLYGYHNLGMNTIFLKEPSPLQLNNKSKFDGVFLHQYFNIPPNPYYSVRALEEQTITFHNEPIPWYFKVWRGTHVSFEDTTNRQTAIVFNSSNAVAKAVYKGHLVSNQHTATALNNGRHILQDPRAGFSNNWYLVYEDDGLIYYTYSSDNGATWSKEVLVSDISRNARNACIATYLNYTEEYTSGIPVIGILWEYRQGNDHGVAFRCYDMNSNHWSNIERMVVLKEDDVYPVLTAAWRNSKLGHEFYAIFDSFDNGISLYRISNPTTSPSFTLLESNVPGSSSSAIHPSVASNFNASLLYICWEEDGYIKYNYYNVASESGPSSPIWSTTNNMNRLPSIAYAGGNFVDIAWSYFDGEIGLRFRHAHVHATIPEEEAVMQQVTYTNNLTEASIGAHSNQVNLYATVETDNYTVRYLYYDGESWDMLSEYDSGEHAGVNVFGDKFMGCWTWTSGGQPYMIRQDIINSSNKSTLYSTDFREIDYNLSNLSINGLQGNIRIKFGDVKVSGMNGTQSIPFVPLSTVNGVTNFQQLLPILVSPDMQFLSLKYRIEIENLNIPTGLNPVRLFGIRINNAQGVSQIVSQYNLAAGTGNHLVYEDSLRIPLNGYAGQNIIVNTFGVHQQLNHHYTLINIREFRDVSNEKRLEKSKDQLTSSTLSLLPNEYNLEQNYPNPFNPVTTIPFDLPEASMVKLTVYDISGRLIRTLIEGYYAPGHYQITWNGKDDNGISVASGVYLYRLQAGNHQYIRKMMLMK